MTDAELRIWAVEQAVASFGVAGCESEWNLTRRVECIMYHALDARTVVGSGGDVDTPAQSELHN